MQMNRKEYKKNDGVTFQTPLPLLLKTPCPKVSQSLTPGNTLFPLTPHRGVSPENSVGQGPQREIYREIKYIGRTEIPTPPTNFRVDS